MIECPKCQMQCPDEALFCGNCATQLPRGEGDDPFVGLCIDNKYTIIKRIAAGGMGVVYLAKQRGAGQFVAIKKLHPEFYRDKVIVERFMDEARSYGKITHPNAVKLHDLLNVKGQICIVMEFVAGKTLTQYIESGYVFSLRQIVDISLQIADALGTVHRAGIIHRDLKTENIMLMETVPGRFSVKILDFGIAKMLDKPVDRKTKDGLIVGTPEFMSPEQCYGTDVDNRTDIYAYGILMYVMICNRLPYECDSPMGLLQMQINAPLPDLVRPNGEHVPTALSVIVHKCMMKASADRYDSFTGVIADLMQFQESGMISLVTPIVAPNDMHKNTVKIDSHLDDPTKVESRKSDPKTVTSKKSDPKDFAFVLAPNAPDEMSTIHDGDDDDLGLEIDLDSGVENSSPDRDDDGDASEEHDSDCYSLGDISEIEMPATDSAAPAPNRVLRTVAIVAIVIIALGGAAFAFLNLPGEDPIESREPVAESEGGGTAQEQAPNVAPSTAQGAANAAIDAVPAAPVPIEPSKAAAREVLMRGVARACIDASIRDANAGNLDAAQTTSDFAQAQNTTLSQRDADQLAQSREQLTSFRNIWQSAQNAGQKCSKIDDLIAQVPDSALGMKEKLTDIGRKCQRKLEAPPTTL